MPRTKMARLSEQEWRMLRKIRAREMLTQRVLIREAEVRSLRELTAERLRLKEAEVASLRADLAELEVRASAAMTARVAEESLVPQL